MAEVNGKKVRNTVKRTGSGDKHTDGKVLSEYRTGVVVAAMRNLAKVGNKSSYELADAEVAQIMDAINAEVIALEVSLRKGYKPETKGFQFKG